MGKLTVSTGPFSIANCESLPEGVLTGSQEEPMGCPNVGSLMAAIIIEFGILQIIPPLHHLLPPLPPLLAFIDFYYFYCYILSYFKANFCNIHLLNLFSMKHPHIFNQYCFIEIGETKIIENPMIFYVTQLRIEVFLPGPADVDAIKDPWQNDEPQQHFMFFLGDRRATS